MANDIVTLNFSQLFIETTNPDNIIDEIEKICLQHSKNSRFYYEYKILNSRNETINQEMRGDDLSSNPI